MCEIKKRNDAMMNEIKSKQLDTLILELRTLPPEKIENFMAVRWKPFLASLVDQVEHEFAVVKFFRAQLDVLDKIADYIPKMSEERFEAISPALEQIISLKDEMTEKGNQPVTRTSLPA